MPLFLLLFFLKYVNMQLSLINNYEGIIMKKSLFSLVILLSGSLVKAEKTSMCAAGVTDSSTNSMSSCMTSCASDKTASNNVCPEQSCSFECDAVCDEHESNDMMPTMTTRSCETTTVDMTEMTLMQMCMMQAAANNNLEMVEKMVAAGVDVNCCDETGKTPLMCAVDMGHLEMYQYLMQKGADAFMRDNAGCSVLFYACSKTRSVDMEIDQEKICAHQEIILNLLEMGIDF
jgi:hypothetical protein